MCPALVNAQKGVGLKYILLTYIYTLGICIPQTPSHLILFQVLATPGYNLSNLNRDRPQEAWPLRQMGIFHSKDTGYCQHSFKSSSIVFFQAVVT